MSAKCPKCEAPISRVIAEHIDVQGRTKRYKGVGYVCPACGCLISIEMDPLVAAKADS